MNADAVRRQWADRSGEFSPAYYAHYGPNETSDLLRGLLGRHVDADAPVLELGCSSGRHLAHLHDHGFEHVAGIEVNDDAFDVMAEAYPALAADGEFYHAAIEDVVGDIADDRFGAVYSVETLQHLHPESEWVFGELARIAGTLLVTVENEGGADSAGVPGEVNYVNGEFPLYYRDWSAVFAGLGLDEVHTESAGYDTVRAFRSRGRTGRARS